MSEDPFKKVDLLMKALKKFVNFKRDDDATPELMYNREDLSFANPSQEQMTQPKQAHQYV